MLKYAASIAFLAVVGFLATSLLTSELAFAEVARAILGIKNARFEISSVIHEPGEKPKSVAMGECIMELPDRMRVKISDGTVYTVDLNADKMLITEPERKVATLFEGLSKLEDEESGLPEDFLTEIQDHLRRAEGSKDFGDIKYEKLGEKKFVGKLAIGYRVTDPDEELFDYFDIWADVTTALPIQVDYTKAIGETKVVSSLKNFRFDQQQDAKAFSLEAPEGYKLENGNLKELMETADEPLPVDLEDLE